MMVPVAKMNGAGTGKAPGSILSLDKSELPFVEQLEEASGMLGINPKSITRNIGLFGIGPSKVMSEDETYGPRNEWALKWLLNKLSVDIEQGSPCLEPQAWILLQCLMLTVNSAKVAQLLASKKFLGIVRRTLSWLRKALRGYQVGFCEGNSESGSGGRKMSKKRKRDESEAKNSEPKVISFDLMNALILPICESLYQAQHLKEYRDSGTIIEQLNMALRCDLVDTANVVSDAVYLLDATFRTIFNNHSESDPRRTAVKRWGFKEFEWYTQTYVDFWNLQVSGGSNINDSRLNVLMETCLLPSLLLLHACRSDSLKDHHTGTTDRILIDFITANVAEPLQRAANTTAQTLFANLDEIMDERQRSSPAFNPSQFDERQVSSEPKRRHTNDEISLISQLVLLFFKIAIKCVPRETPKSCKKRNFFLQKLFDELKTSLASQFGPEASDSRPGLYTKAVKALLDQAVKSDVQLRPATIDSILRQVSGLFSESETEQVEWEVVKLCLENNADVFFNSKSVLAGPNFRQKTNDLMKRLLTKLDTPSNTDDSSKSNRHYTLKLEGVLIPLIRAFGSVRSLSGFLEHWKAKLDKHASLGIWADDDLLFTVQEMLESCLSMDFIRKALEGIESRFAGLDASPDDVVVASDLVILDCVVGGRYSEDSRSQLSHRVFSVYSTLATSLLKYPGKYGGLKWRVWRILASINQAWLYDDSASSMLSIDRQLTEIAFETIDVLGGMAETDFVNSFQEQSFAFSFMSSLSSNERTSQESTEDIQRLFNKSLNRILDLNNLVCQQLEGDLFRVLKPIESQHYWSGKSIDISSHDTLYISCIARLLSQSAALVFIDEETQKRLLSQLTLLARYEKCLRSPLDPTIGYSWLWNYTQGCEAIYEQKSFARKLRDRQCKTLISLLGSEHAHYWADSSEERTSALESLLGVSSFQFSAENKINIANGLLEDLRHWTNLPHGKIDKHLQLLVKVADVSRKTGKQMEIFQNIKKDKDSLQERSAVILLAEIVSVCALSTERPACNNALCDLTRIILKHIYGTLATDASAQYFTMFYQWIGAEIERESTNTPVCLDDWPSSGSMLLVSMTALNFYHENRQQILEVLDPENHVIDNIRKQHFERVLRICTNREFSLKVVNDRIDLAATLQCLYGYLDLFLAHPRMLEVYERLLKAIEINDYRQLPSEDQEIKDHSELHALYYRITYKIPLFRNADAFINELVPGKSNNMLCSQKGPPAPYAFQQYISSLDYEAIDKILPVLPVNYQHHAILGLTDTQATGLQPCINRMLLSFCGTIKSSRLLNTRHHALNCLNTILRKFPKLESQYMIEDLLVAITSAASKSVCSYFDHNPADLFIALCRLFSSILECHRPKLGGRYHLTVPILQALIQLLFIPYAKVALPAKDKSPFEASHASIYARLLTTLCDPSPSAVAFSRPRQQIHLNDETKRAKEVAGQHLQYLIMTYCECRINCEFAGEGMKEALEPGLWAVIGCLGDDTRRTMNAGLDPNGRAIWKRLYADWKKFGEWHAGQGS